MSTHNLKRKRVYISLVAGGKQAVTGYVHPACYGLALTPSERPEGAKRRRYPDYNLTHIDSGIRIPLGGIGPIDGLKHGESLLQRVGALGIYWNQPVEVLEAALRDKNGPWQKFREQVQAEGRAAYEEYCKQRGVSA